MTKVAINGFGRIGRNTLRAAIREGIYEKIDYVAINDPGLTPENAAHVFKYDSVMGKFDGTVEVAEDGLVINGKKILFFAEKDPAALPWAKLGVEVVERSLLEDNKQGFVRHNCDKVAKSIYYWYKKASKNK